MGSILYGKRERPTFVPSDMSEGESDIGDYRKAKKELKSYSNLNCLCNTTEVWGGGGAKFISCGPEILV